MVKRKAPSQPAAEDADAVVGDAQLAKVAKTDSEPLWKNKEKVLLLSSRGIIHRCRHSCQESSTDNCSSHIGSQHVPAGCRHRHLMLDLMQLLPHCKKDAKLDTKTDRAILNEVADMKVQSCSAIAAYTRCVYG